MTSVVSTKLAAAEHLAGGGEKKRAHAGGDVVSATRECGKGAAGVVGAGGLAQHAELRAPDDGVGGHEKAVCGAL